MNGLFVEASKLKLRFPTKKGWVSVEDLWDMPLTELNNLAKKLHREVTESETVDFINSQTAENTACKRKFDVVKYVIDTKLAEAKAAEERELKRQKKAKILSLMEEKENENLKDSSMDELKAMLNDLDS